MIPGKQNKSGFLGVYWHNAAKKWCCQIRSGKKILYIGLFKSARAAAKAYDKEARRLGKTNLNMVDPNDWDD